jgi:hypothetical protein
MLSIVPVKAEHQFPLEKLTSLFFSISTTHFYVNREVFTVFSFVYPLNLHKAVSNMG